MHLAENGQGLRLFLPFLALSSIALSPLEDPPHAKEFSLGCMYFSALRMTRKRQVQVGRKREKRRF